MIFPCASTVTAADERQYRTTDDQNVGMDTAKIITNPQGGYLAVYHHLINNVFQDDQSL